MVLRLALPLLLALGAPAAARERGPAGLYRLIGEQDVASHLALKPDGRFDYELVAGALDERAQGRWSAADGVVILVTEPKPVPPAFTRAASGNSDSAPLRVQVSWPDGRGIAGVDLRIGFDEGEPLDSYTQADGWDLPADESRTPRWIELAVPMHDVRSPRFPINLAAGHALAFTLTPNDLGVIDFAGVRIEVAGKALLVERGGGRLRYERVGTQ